MQSVKLLILLTIWIASVLASFFLIMPDKGEMYGLGFCVLYLSVISVFLDKWVLLIHQAAAAPRGDKFLERFQNLSYIHNVKGVDFYYSRLAFKNVLAVEWKNRKILIFDKAFKQGVNNEEALIYAMEAFEDGSIKGNTFFLFVFTVFNIPLVLLEKVLLRYWLFNLVSRVWLTPFLLVSESYERSKRTLVTHHHAKDYIGPQESFLSSTLITVTGIYQSKNDDLINMLFIKNRI